MRLRRRYAVPDTTFRLSRVPKFMDLSSARLADILTCICSHRVARALLDNDTTEHRLPHHGSSLTAGLRR